jgi:exodeoxyribonuclease VII large subunit
MKPEAGAPASQREILTVSELTRRVKATLESKIGSVRVAGEVSNLRVPKSGHFYFTLKDAESQIDVVLFSRYAAALRFHLKDGLEVVVGGEVSVYLTRGQLQVVASTVEPKGLGALQLAFEQLKEKLKKEGLFDAARKRPIPFLPRRIGVVTSITGAAIRDICQIVLRRFPRASILIHPAKVQGEGAAEEVAEAVRRMNRIGGIDVLIVGRGGGSLEDLWAFNEEPVARAVAGSRIPVVSAVGHETDFTICDFAADLRAPTPSAAAELVAPRLDELLSRLDLFAQRLRQGLGRAFEERRARVDAAAARLDPRRFLRAVNERQQRVDDLGTRLAGAAARLIARRREGLAATEARLEGLNPRRILARGYSVTLALPAGKAVRKPADAPPGTRLRTILAEGEVFSETRGVE